MADVGDALGPVVVEFPEEFDFGNAGEVAGRLRAAIAPGVGVVVADLTRTVFCDSSGVRIMLLARDWASADDVKLRLGRFGDSVPCSHAVALSAGSASPGLGAKVAPGGL